MADVKMKALAKITELRMDLPDRTIMLAGSARRPASGREAQMRQLEKRFCSIVTLRALAQAGYVDVVTRSESTCLPVLYGYDSWDRSWAWVETHGGVDMVTAGLFLPSQR